MSVCSIGETRGFSSGMGLVLVGVLAGVGGAMVFATWIGAPQFNPYQRSAAREAAFLLALYFLSVNARISGG